MSDKQWDDPLEWDTYHDEPKFFLWERYGEYYDDWVKEMGVFMRVVRAAKSVIHHGDQHLRELEKALDRLEQLPDFHKRE